MLLPSHVVSPTANASRLSCTGELKDGQFLKNPWQALQSLEVIIESGGITAIDTSNLISFYFALF